MQCLGWGEDQLESCNLGDMAEHISPELYDRGTFPPGVEK